MEYFEIKLLKKSKYQNFIKKVLKENEYIIISLLCDFTPNEQFFVDLGNVVALPQTCDFHIVNISEDEKLYCYINCYKRMYTIFEQHNSFEEIFNAYNIYRLMFATKDKITVVCMCDEILKF